MDERSLDEFLEGASDDSREEKTPEKTDEAASSTVVASHTGGDVEPATATAHVVPDGCECPSCGQTVTRLWTADGQRVCQSCKEW